jgi:hypothetical protein
MGALLNLVYIEAGGFFRDWGPTAKEGRQYPGMMSGFVLLRARESGISEKRVKHSRTGKLSRFLARSFTLDVMIWRGNTGKYGEITMDRLFIHGKEGFWKERGLTRQARATRRGTCGPGHFISSIVMVVGSLVMGAEVSGSWW